MKEWLITPNYSFVFKRADGRLTRCPLLVTNPSPLPFPLKHRDGLLLLTIKNTYQRKTGNNSNPMILDREVIKFRKTFIAEKSNQSGICVIVYPILHNHYNHFR